MLFERAPHLADALFVARGEVAQLHGQCIGELLLAAGEFQPRLVRVVGERGAQFVQPRIGALDRIRQLLAQFAAAGALFVAQQVAEPVLGASQQQGDEQAERRQHGDQQQDEQERGRIHPHSVAAGVASAASGA